MKDTKLASNTFKVTYSDGETVLVKPASWKSLEDIELLTKNLIKQMVDKDAHFGSLLKGSNTEFWGDVTKLASLLPVVGVEENGIDVDRIEDIDQIVRIFLTTSPGRDPKTGGLFLKAEESMEPSLVCRVNSLNFQVILSEVMDLLRNPPKKKRKKAQSSTKSNQPETQKQI